MANELYLGNYILHLQFNVKIPIMYLILSWGCLNLSKNVIDPKLLISKFGVKIQKNIRRKNVYHINLKQLTKYHINSKNLYQPGETELC